MFALSRISFSIAAKVALASLVVGIATGTLLGALKIRIDAGETVATTQRQLEETANSLYPAVGLAVWQLDTIALEQLADGVVKDPAISRMRVDDTEGRSLAVVDQARTDVGDSTNNTTVDPHETSDEPRSRVLDWITSVLTPEGSLDLEARRDLVYAASGGDVAIGTLTLTGDERTLLSAIRDNAAATLLSVLAAGTIFTLSVLFVTYFLLTRPLKSLSRDLATIELNVLDGLSNRLGWACRRTDDIGVLARSFTRVLDRVSTSREMMMQSERRFRGLIEGSVQGCIIYRRNSVLFANEAAARILGYESASDLIMMEDLTASYMDGYTPVSVDDLEEEDTLEWEHEWRLRKDGGRVAVSSTLRRIRWDDEWAVQSTIIDVTDKLEAEEELRRMATRDSLTGLANRTLFKERVIDSIGRARPGSIGVLHIDLDRFKQINDTMGHDTGDEVILETGRRIADALPGNAYLARLGGDDFGLLVENARFQSDFADIADSLRNVIAKPLNLDGKEIVVTATIGASVWPVDGDNADELLRTAETAMYVGKAEKKHAIRFFDSGMDQEVHERLALEQDLARAIENRELFLHYQPKVSAENGALIGCEALVRWRRADGSLVPPDRFIPIAEETGMIGDLGAQVISMAGRQIAEWRHELGIELPVAVNVSAIQFAVGDVVADFKDAVTTNNLRHDLLQMEITETATMRQLDEVLPILRHLRDLGIAIAIDDFGTGYSSLSYLKRMPITHLKLDRSFVVDLPDPDAETIASAILALGHALRFKVIAEGVENAEQAVLLRNLGYDQFQGYHFAEPMSPADLAKWVRTHAAGHQPDEMVEANIRT